MVRYKGVIVDLDGTLADCEHRRVKAQKPDGTMDWDVFFEGMENDGLATWCLRLIEAMRMSAHIFIVSGRSDSHRKVTEAWLKKHRVPFDALFMRKAGDRRPDTEVKLELYNQHIKDRYDVWFAVDDRKCVVDMWRANGIVCLACAEGNF